MKAVRYIFALCPVIAALSCGRDCDTPSDERIAVEFVCSAQTKAVSDYDVRSLDLLAFRADNGLIDSHSRCYGDTICASLSRNTDLDYFVLANLPEGTLSDVVMRDDFLGSVSYLAQSASAPVMTGRGSARFVKETEVGVSLDRMPCKVTLKGITPALYPQESGEIILWGVYLINVNGTCPFSMDPAAGDTWYNKLDYDKSLPAALAGMLYQFPRMKLTGPETLTDSYSFYCCPNPIDNGTDSSMEPNWSVRNTRLVVELSIGGNRHCYPVTLPAMECNRHYIIDNLVITGSGSSSPDLPVIRSAMTFTVSVLDWEPKYYDLDFTK